MAPQSCIALGTRMHGKWGYKTAVRYEAGTLKDGTPVWQKAEVVAESTSLPKTTKLAIAEATKRGLPYLPDVRHNTRREVNA